ncbi:aspartyl-tRNA(Asn)/glutamyl-tRNA(Gln) amidotransferase subunit A [Bacilli bacterium PM5-3]|nr:aspartyl-tRNA(Asn)/glutamyl-tRNA(Gln) amidotransferase subunit A [Bacilli bacterium PM5-3]
MHKKTIIDLHDDLVNKRISPKELIDSSIKHMEEVNGKLNAINSFCEISDYDIDSDSYLAGIPYAMKDLAATKGILTTSSSHSLENFIPPFSATIYNRFSDCKAKMVVKSNLDEYGMGGLNINSIYGRTHNPYNLQRGTGGSSGGSVALVAAGCVPFATGTDTGDSVRRPAAYCGVYGFKPTWGVISRYGIFPYASSYDHTGVFTRCVDDIAILMEELNGPDENDPTTMTHPKEYFFKDLKPTDKKLKIGYLKELIESFDNELVLKQFDETVEYLKSLGHEVVEVNISKDILRCNRGSYHIITNVEGASNLANLNGIGFGERVTGDSVDDSIIKSRSYGLSKYSIARLVIGPMSSLEANREKYYIQAKKVRRLIINEFDRIYKDVDILVAPANNSAAYDPAVTVEMSDDARLIAENHLSIGNAIGAPSITIPTHFDDEGLPYAMTFMAKPYDDQLVLDFAKQFENGLLKENYLGLQSFYNVYAKEVK